MAITYQSAGAGVATEASGGALSPRTPVGTNAGDILIAHCGYEGTTTAPSTPSGWTLLSGPHTIESAHRHWIFGRVSDGTDDDVAVPFGTPAVTTMRTARIYSFAGREAGTITELVKNFAHISHATDPQMPTVTTEMAGALAVACIFQLDDNAIANATGETGGDWTEPVAEYTQAATTPDSCLAIQTCTPTTDPGTVSGGSIATINDPCGVIGFQIKQSNHQSVATELGALDLTGFAPTVQTPVVVNTGLGQLDLNGFSPTVTVSTTVTIGLGQLDLTGFAPTINITNNQLVTPEVGQVDLTGFAPTAQTPVVVTPELGQITLTGLSPTVQTPVTVTTNIGQIDLTGFAPTVTIEAGGVTVTPGAGVLDLNGFSPTITVSNNQIINTGLGALDLNGFSPTITVSNNQVVTPGLGQLDLTGFSPVVTNTNHVIVRTLTGQIILEGLAPTVLGSYVHPPDSGTAPSFNDDDEIIALELI